MNTQKDGLVGILSTHPTHVTSYSYSTHPTHVKSYS